MINLRRIIPRPELTILAALTFVYIFEPPLIHVNAHMVIEAVAIMYILWNLIRKKGAITIERRYVNILLNFIPFIIYETIAVFVHISAEPSNSQVFQNEFFLVFRTIIRITIIDIAYYEYVNTHNISYEEQLDNLKYVTFIQLFFVILTLLVPGIRSMIVNLIINNSSDDNLVSVYMRLSTRRGYGLAGNLFDSFGYIMSILFAVSFTGWLENGKKSNLFVSLSIIFACILNARTGVLLCVIVMVAALIFYKKSVTILKYIIATLIALPVIYTVVMSIWESYFPENFKWLSEGINEAVALILLREYIGTFEALHDGIFWPPNVIFGTGASPENIAGMSTDVGYVQVIWRYGAIGTLLYLGGYIKSVLSYYSFSKNDRYKCLTITLVMIVLVYLFKIYSINNLGAHSIMIMLIIYGGCLNESNKRVI